MKQALLSFVTIVLLAYLGLCVLLFVRQRSMIYFPQPGNPVAGRTQIQLQVDEVSLNITVLERAGNAAVLYFGGNAEEVGLSLPELAAAFPDRALYLMHYRGYGGSSGSPSEKALVSDALALFDQLAPRYPDIAVVGRSLGSGIAIQLAGQRPVSRLILVTPYDSILGIAAEQFPYIPVRLLLLDKFESWKHAAQISAPTTLIAAEHDEIIPMRRTTALLAGFRPGIAHLEVVRDSSHNTLSDKPDYVQLLSQATAQTPARRVSE